MDHDPQAITPNIGIGEESLHIDATKALRQQVIQDQALLDLIGLSLKPDFGGGGGGGGGH